MTGRGTSNQHNFSAKIDKYNCKKQNLPLYHLLKLNNFKVSMSNQYKDKSSWIRILFVILFWLIFYVSQIVIAAVVIAQCAFRLIAGQPNQYLMQLGDGLSKYVAQLVSYMTFNTDQRPFPFTEFPKSDLVIAVDS